MNILKFKKQIKLNVFTIDMVRAYFEKEYSQPLQKINAMTKSNKLIQLKRGVYAFPDEYRNHPINLISTANMLCKSSYVSFEYALSHYGLIPERVYTITSATTLKKREYKTDIGNFSYTKINSNAYPLGLEWLFNEKDGGYMIATAEKALCDTMHHDKRISTLGVNDIEEYLEEDLRIEYDDLNNLDSKLIWYIAMAYRSKKLALLAASMKKRKKGLKID